MVFYVRQAISVNYYPVLCYNVKTTCITLVNDNWIIIGNLSKVVLQLYFI